MVFFMLLGGISLILGWTVIKVLVANLTRFRVVFSLSLVVGAFFWMVFFLALKL